jgi:hypothetical protein
MVFYQLLLDINLKIKFIIYFYKNKLILKYQFVNQNKNIFNN